MKSTEKTKKSQVDRILATGKYTKKTAWNECLFNFARHLDGKKWVVFKRTFYLSRGEFYCNKSKLANRWGWSRSKVQRFFTRKEQAGEILQRKIHGVGTLITVVDFDKSIEDWFK